MSTIEVSRLLGLALRLDALLSSTAGLLTLFGASYLQPVLGLSGAATIGLGGFMLAYGLLAGWLGYQTRLPALLAWGIVIGNLIWVIGSIVLSFSQWIAPTPTGVALLLGQAAAIAVITDLQFLGLRRSPTALVSA